MSNDFKEVQSNFDRRKEELAQKVQELVKANEAPVEEEKVTLSEGSQEPEMSEIEKQAYSLGWRKQGEYSGSNFVPAEEYVRRQPLFERIDRQGKELRDLKNMNQQIAQHLASLRTEAYEQASKDLESRRIQAINDGDSNQVFNTERQIRDMEQRKASDPLVKQAEAIQQPQRHPEVDSFEARNGSWYNTNTSENRRMMEAAMLADKQLAEQASEQGRVLDPKEHLRMVEDAVRSNFKHRFEQPVVRENPKASAPPMVGISTSSKDKPNSSSELVSRLTAEQRRIGEHFNKSNKAYTLEKYAQDLERMGRLK